MENVKIFFTTLFIFTMLAVCLYFASAFPLANFGLGVMNTFFICWSFMLAGMAAYLSADSARDEVARKITRDTAFYQDTMEKVQKILPRTTFIYCFNFVIVLFYVAACAFAASQSFYFTATVLLITGIVTFIFPRVIISFMEFCEQTITEFDDRRRRR